MPVRVEEVSVAGQCAPLSARERSGDIRVWAKTQGIPVSDRGRVPSPALLSSTKPRPEDSDARLDHGRSVVAHGRVDFRAFVMALCGQLQWRCWQRAHPTAELALPNTCPTRSSPAKKPALVRRVHRAVLETVGDHARPLRDHRYQRGSVRPWLAFCRRRNTGADANGKNTLRRVKLTLPVAA